MSQIISQSNALAEHIYQKLKQEIFDFYLLPHDRALHPCIAAYDSGYVRLQNSILTHHVHAEYESTGIARKVSDRLIHEHNRYL